MLQIKFSYDWSLVAEILKFENVYAWTHTRTQDRLVYYKLTMSFWLRCANNVFTKFCLILSIRSQNIEQKPNSDAKQGP